LNGVRKKQAHKQALAEFDRFGLAGFEKHWPAKLSGGMKQRAALLRTFLAGREVMLLDEPFGALDAQTRLQLQDLLLRLCEQRGQAVLFVTHDLAEAVALSDRVLVMSSRPGRIMADVAIDLPRPRSIRLLHKDARFHALYASLWSHLEAGWAS